LQHFVAWPIRDAALVANLSLVDPTTSDQQPQGIRCGQLAARHAKQHVLSQASEIIGGNDPFNQLGNVSPVGRNIDPVADVIHDRFSTADMFCALHSSPLARIA
jgi:hypothetical protein